MGRLTLRGAALAPGSVAARALVLVEPLSLWGGLEPRTGRISDAHHPQRGETVAGRVLVMRGGRGSSSSSSILAEAVRAGTAPAGIIVGEPDLILTIGAVVAHELYGVRLPVALLDRAALASIPPDAGVRIEAVAGAARVTVRTA